MELYDIPHTGIQMAFTEVADTTGIFDKGRVEPRRVPGFKKEEYYVPWGTDNRLPFRIARLIGSDEVTAQNKLFNVLTCYGAGPRIASTDEYRQREATTFARRNGLHQFLLEQLTDLKYYYMSVCVVILNREGDEIVRLVHKEACYCRLQRADRFGRINHIYYADWDSAGQPKTVERIPLLSLTDPIGDLAVRMGEDYGVDGLRRRRTPQRKFAILLRFPTVGCKYYPVPYYAAMFRGGSYDEKRLIAAAKIAKVRNHASVKYQIEVNRDYWQHIIAEERITDPFEAQKRIRKEKENIRDFVAGVHNSGKAWITGYYVDPNGHEVRDIRVVNIEGAKDGGDYADDINVASNTLCYADNTHPNLVGAVPGKSQNNNSGSDKRELFTMKQALETAWKDILLSPILSCFAFNGWTSTSVELPIVQLTTLDEHRDVKELKGGVNEGSYKRELKRAYSNGSQQPQTAPFNSLEINSPEINSPF